ncbi:MetQ/NlpA family ABC transporter substrate-binding protein, partial [Wohlfahrtiimonas larvae]
MKKILLLLSTLFFITACSDDSKTQTNNTTSQKTIHMISSPGDFADMIRHYIGPELQKRGYQYDLKESTNGILPNQSVVDGSADLNLFQHKPYL